MNYRRFNIIDYKALIESKITVLDLPVPIIGVNESGKSSALEAITNFDFRNDELVKAKGWKFSNRYKPENSLFSVACDIEITQSELDTVRAKHLLPELEPVIAEEEVESDEVVDIATPVIAEAPETETEPIPVPEPVVEPVHDDLLDINLEREILTITRVFNAKSNTKHYEIRALSGDRIEALAQDIISKLPRVYYFDNFLETPIPDSVAFGKSYISGTDDLLNEDQRIIEGAFSDTGVSLRDFFNNKDADAQATLVSRVNDHITKQIIDDWRKMHVPVGELDLTRFNNVKLAFKLGENKKSIEVKVIEQFPGNDNTPAPEVTMKISERSQGFRWFFNFSARKCFAAVHEERFLYLIDEPGSYLHNSAQTVLLDALVSLAKSHPVIYSTHSEFLLDPDKININNIKVVQKQDHAIKLIPLSNATTKRHEGALSTLYNALKMRTPLETIMNKKVVVTEGITDFYFWKPLLDIVFLPGCGAGNNRYLLSMAIGASRKYVAIFDGDTAGDTAQTHYKGLFGDAESVNWTAYNNAKGKPVVLEKLLTGSDVTRIKTITGQSDVKKAITLLFFEDKAEEFWAGVSRETKSNVQYNISTIVAHLKLPKSQIKHGFKL